MKLKPSQRAPLLIALGVIALVCATRGWQPRNLEELEDRTYDWRARFATNFPAGSAGNLGFVYISDESVAKLNDGSLGFHYAVPWPRHVYGRLLRELSAQGAKAVGFDVLFGEPHPDDSPVLVNHPANPDLDALLARLHPGEAPVTAGDQISVESDDFFAWQLQRAGNAVLAADTHLLPNRMFRDHAYAVGDISTEKDSDGILRRTTAVTTNHVWQLGIVLAARELGLDLAKAEVDLPHGKITLRGDHGLERIIPVDAHGSFYIDWSLTPRDSHLFVEPIQQLLKQDRWRTAGRTNDLADSWRGKLVMVGSTATGNNLTDLGATPLQKESYLVSKHWNVANAIITDRFIRRTSFAQDCLIIALLGALAAALTLRMRALPALTAVTAAVVVYAALTAGLFVQHRFWLPLILPVGGTLLMNICLVTWRVIFEQAEKRRVRSVFSRLVSPEVVSELLGSEKISLGGTRREITVFFADVRGFTAFTDASRETAAEVAIAQKLSGAAAEAHFDREARETLGTVNTYLALVADQIKAHGGTLDKYIGDCVMAFWNAPVPTPRHALACVRTAIAAQRAIADLNRQRAGENARRESENVQRTQAGQPPLPPLAILTLGTGINTGQAVVGLMGSDAHILNYTAFGREVNLASRLEGLSGKGRIIIGEATFAALRRDDPVLAATCTALPPVNVKGSRESVNIYEVAWRLPGTESPP